ncbi:hypothetical protein ALT761_03090 [Alteromonas sp. 76-1]|jgi:hypothetical protein|nr:hypothetical protein ALT761_03090 [Alteromonas sp. 76-1]
MIVDNDTMPVCTWMVGQKLNLSGSKRTFKKVAVYFWRNYAL